MECTEKPNFYIRACALFRGGEEERGKIISKCVAAFPHMWIYVSAPLGLFLPADLLLCLSLSACECCFLCVLLHADFSMALFLLASL